MASKECNAWCKLHGCQCKAGNPCEECGERISDDDAIMHYHAGTVIDLEENNNA